LPVGGSFTIADVIADSTGASGGARGLIKLGTGTLVISNAANTYTGATQVNAGTLLVNGNNSSASGAITVADTATLGGTGTLGGATTVQSGGTIRGDTGTGTGTLTTTNVTINNGGNLFANIAASGTNSRLALGTNTLNLLTNSRLVLDDLAGFDPLSLGSWNIATFNSGSTIQL
jgi:autotransporter-associated beta strand protein